MEEQLGLEPQFQQLYEIKHKIGKGSFGSVWCAQHLKGGEEFAVKVIDRRKLKPKDDEAVFREVEVLRDLNVHPNIVNLVDFFHSPKSFHMVLELARGGDLFDRLIKRRTYSEMDARKLVRNLLDAVSYMHACGFCHRDLKPGNLLLLDKEDDVNGLKIADFGFATKCTNQKLKTRCGTPAFVAPEICAGIEYTEAVDVWSCGVIVFILLGGYAPFKDRDRKMLFRKIRAADYTFNEKKYWDPISSPAKRMITRMLTVDPIARINAADTLKSEWMTLDDAQMKSSSSDKHLGCTIDGLKQFNAKQKLKSAVLAATFATSASFWTPNKISFLPDSTVRRSIRSSITLAEGKIGLTFAHTYRLIQWLNAGSTKVWLGQNLDTEKDVAVKVIKRTHETQQDANVLREVAILQSLRHPNVVPLTDFYEEKDKFYMVMELQRGRDVFERIIEKEHYTENDTRKLAKSLLSAVTYIHSMGIAHRDLKPQNLLLKSEEDDSSVMLCDFRLARRVHTPQSLMTRCGTPTYVSPEILKNHPHDESTDMWSIGVLLYVLLVGYPPFRAVNHRDLFKLIRFGEFKFYKKDWNEISEDAKDLIKKLLVVDPSNRLTVTDAANAEWIREACEKDLSERPLRGSLNEMRNSIQERRVSDKAISPLPTN